MLHCQTDPYSHRHCKTRPYSWESECLVDNSSPWTMTQVHGSHLWSAHSQQQYFQVLQVIFVLKLVYSDDTRVRFVILMLKRTYQRFPHLTWTRVPLKMYVSSQHTCWTTHKHHYRTQIARLFCTEDVSIQIGIEMLVLY